MISKLNSRSFFLTVFLVAVVLSVLIHGYWVQQNQKLKPLRIGITNWPGYDVALYAKENGLFEKRGLDVELVRFTSPPDAARALLRGALDASFMNLSVAMQADPNDDSPVFMLVTDISHGSDGIVAQPDIKSIRELKGKKVAAKLGAANHLILLEALNFHKLQPRDVKILDVPNDVAMQLMQKGEVDASAIWQPLLSKIANEINGNIIYTTKDVDTLVIDGLASRSSVLNKKQREFKQFSLAWFDLMQVLDSKPNEVFLQVGKQLGQSPDVFARSYSGLQKGDITLNERMFAKGRLNEAAQQLRQLLEADLRNSRILRHDFQINPQPALSAIEVWGEKAS